MSEPALCQCRRILDFLRDNGGSATTLALRKELDILHPAARIQELRQDGYSIRTVWTTDAMPNGKPHRVALYLLAVGNDGLRSGDYGK